MLKRSRFFISATLVAVLFASLVFFSNPARTLACPAAPPPATLLTLYLRSDLIVVAEIAGEKDGKTTDDYETFYYVDVVRRLKASSVLKGRAPAELAFTKSEYRAKTPPEPEIPSAELEEEEAFVYAPYGYKGFSELRAGARYLFFFTQNAETGAYELTDPVSAARELTDYELDVYKTRLKELQSIVKMKKDQAPALAAWLVRCAEEPSTRWDGVFDLNNSFSALKYDGEYESPRAFKLDKNFHSRTPEIARHVTDAHKATLSNIAFGILQQTSDFEENNDFYFGLTGLIKYWDKARLAMYSFSLLERIDRRDHEKLGAAMNYVAEIIEDEKLSEIARRFSDAAEEMEEAAPDEADAEKPADPATTPAVPEIAEVRTEDAAPAVNPVAEVSTETVEATVAPEVGETPPLREKKVSPDAQNPSLAEVRAKIYQDFVNRYQYLVANGFQIAEEPAESAVSEK